MNLADIDKAIASVPAPKTFADYGRTWQILPGGRIVELGLFPYPDGWQEVPEYLEDRIKRLRRAVWFCKGRALDVRVLVLREIERLEKILLDK